MLYVSTDYVYGSNDNSPLDPDNNECVPCNVYGATKLNGELEAVSYCNKLFIVRISWLFGLNGNNFVKAILKASKNTNINVVSDQFGIPTYTKDLARLLVDMIETDKYGKYNVSNDGEYISRYELAKKIFDISGYDNNVIPVTTEEYEIRNKKCKRQLNSRFDMSKLVRNGFRLLPNWNDAIERYIDELKEGTK